jgi:hypothetical protein
MKTEVLGKKFVPMSLCAPQIPRDLTWDRTRSLSENPAANPAIHVEMTIL